MATDLSAKIEDNAQAPAKARHDQTSAEQHSLPDQIAADEYLSRVGAAARTGLPIRFMKARPPGAV